MKRIDMSIAQLALKKKMKVLSMPLRAPAVLIRNTNLHSIVRLMAQAGKVAY